MQLHHLLKLDYTQSDQIWLQDQKSLRKLVGILGMALPAMLYIFVYVDSAYDKPIESISHYYYTRVGSILVLVVGLLAFFLIIYKGKQLIDFYISSIAGLGALLLLLFPTSNLSITTCNSPTVTHLRANPFREHFHLASAGIFLACLAYMSFFLFTKTDQAQVSNEKKIRNRIYRFCAVMMAAALLVIVFWGVIWEDQFYDDNHLTFWMETVAVEFFGISWLIKGETLFKDKVA